MPFPGSGLLLRHVPFLRLAQWRKQLDFRLIFRTFSPRVLGFEGLKRETVLSQSEFGPENFKLSLSNGKKTRFNARVQVLNAGPNHLNEIQKRTTIIFSGSSS